MHYLVGTFAVVLVKLSESRAAVESYFSESKPEERRPIPLDEGVDRYLGIGGVATRHDPLRGNYEMTLSPMKSSHLAINFINTTWVSPSKYSTRTKREGLAESCSYAFTICQCPLRPGTLLWKARQLREIALQAIQTRKSGRRPPLDALNAFLENVNCCQQANALIDP